MLFAKVLYAFLFLFLNHQKSVGAQKCITCQPRNFIEIDLKCICPDHQFCDDSNKKCNNCGDCYATWNNLIKQGRNDIDSILQNLISKYQIDINELKSLIKMLSESATKQENGLSNLGKFSDQIEKDKKNVSNNLKQLKKALNKVDKLLKKTTNVINHDKALKYLEEINIHMKKLFETLKNLKFNVSNDVSLLISKIETISDGIKNIDGNLPIIRGNSLNLALATGSDIDLLESVVASYEGNSSLSSSNIKNDTWIEKDLVELFVILNNYQKPSFDIEALQNNTSHLRKWTEKISTKLKHLLRKHENFQKLYKQIKTIENLQQRLHTLTEKITDLNKKLLVIQKRKEALKREMNEFMRNIQLFNEIKKVFEKNKDEMEELRQEMNVLIAIYKEIKKVNPIGTLIEETKENVGETMIRKKIIEEHCMKKNNV